VYKTELKARRFFQNLQKKKTLLLLLKDCLI